MPQKLLSSLLAIPQKIFTKDGVNVHPGRVMLFSFIFVIAVGTYLLMMPWATVKGELAFIDALFTSTSAVCVTGLVVVDTGATFTFWGQFLLMVLIEIGGLGIMTFSTFFMLSFGKKIRFGERSFLKENIGFLSHSNVWRVLFVILMSVLFLELIGAFFLWIRFQSMMPAGDAVFHSVFYAISAFCTAGFTIFPDSLMQFRSDVLVNVSVMYLITVGGLGFFVTEDVIMKIRAFFKREKGVAFSLQSKIIIITTFSSILAGAVLFYFLESGNLLKEMSFPQRMMTSLFETISVRNAGLTTINWSQVTNGTSFISIILMFIGGAPGSCVGGIKVTTFCVLALLVISRLKGKTSVSVFKRRIPQETVTKSISIFAAAFLFVVIIAMVLEVTEVRGESILMAREKFIAILFEIVSAFGTVGMSLGITPGLTFLGKWVIIITMFVGRIGPLAVALMIIPEEKKDLYAYPEESILTG